MGTPAPSEDFAVPRADSFEIERNFYDKAACIENQAFGKVPPDGSRLENVAPGSHEEDS